MSGARTSRAETAVLAGMLGLASACEPLQEIKGEDAASIPTEIQRIFDARCNQLGCHGGPSVAEGLDLSAAHSAEVLDRQATQVSLALVERGNVDGSYLALKLMPSPPVAIVGERMPTGMSFDDPDLARDVAILLGWIAGADLPSPGSADGNASDGDSGTSGLDPSAGDTGSPDTSATATDEAGETALEPGQLCGIEDLKPGAPNPIVAGAGAMELPAEIGDILADNCGCHYADDLVVGPPVVDYADALPLEIATWADWQGMVGAKTVLESSRERLVADSPLPMPPAPCDVGGGESMDPAARAVMLDWIDAGGPDGAHWP